MKTHTRVDKPLLIIAALLATTLIAFFAGALPYPFGWIVLTVLLVARIAQLRLDSSRKKS